MAQPGEALDDVSEDVEEAASVDVVARDPVPRITPRDQVIDAAGNADAQRARHGASVERRAHEVAAAIEAVTLSQRFALSHLDGV